jgi:Fe-S cluster biosynthesis and repair protein YggX
MQMADESCGPTNPVAPSAPAKPGQRVVHCVKFDKDMPGLERIPWKGELGKRVYENVSADAWKLWIEYSKMLVNEYRLNPLDPASQKIMERPAEGEGLSSTDFSLWVFGRMPRPRFCHSSCSEKNTVRWPRSRVMSRRLPRSNGTPQTEVCAT